MFTRMVTAVLASTALAAAPALADPPADRGGGPPAGQQGGSPAGAAMDARANSQGPANASPTGIENANPNSVLGTAQETPPEPPPTGTGRMNSQGPANASPTGIENANSNSVLAESAVDSSALPGLTVGQSVQTSGGTTLGTVSQLITGSDGSIRMVIVTSPSGEKLRLAPTTLSISGDVVTTTSTDFGD